MASTGFAQRLPGGFTGQPGSRFVDTIPQGDVLVDTFPIFYFHGSTFYREQAFSDSIMDITFRQNEPQRQRTWEYRNLGVNGSAATPLWFEPSWRRGMQVGLQAFDIYTIPLDSIRHYRLEKAYTQTAYYTGGEQANGYFTAKFSRNFANGVNFSLDYRRLTYLGTRTLFPDQNTRNTSLGLGFWLGGTDSRYQSFISISSNKIEQDNNGGIEEGPQREDQFDTPGSAVVFLDNSGTRYEKFGLRYLQYFEVRKKSAALEPPLPNKKRIIRTPLDSAMVDSTGQDTMAMDTSRTLTGKDSRKSANLPVASGNRQQYWIGHSISYQNDRYTFYDTDIAADGDWYGDLLTDQRGLRHFIKHQSVKNHFTLLTFRPQKVQYRTPRLNRGLLEAGIEHTIHQLDLEASDSTIQNLFLTGKWDVALGEALRLELKGHFGLLDQAGDYRVDGNLQIDLGDKFTLQARLVNQLNTPTVMQSQFYMSQELVWSNTFDKTLETNLEVQFGVPQWSLSLVGGYHLINNFIYFDSDFQARQTATPISIGQLGVQKTLRAGPIFLENQVAFQVASEDFIRIPGIFGKHSLYFKGKLFQVLDTRIGTDLRYNTSYFSDTYAPAIGNFRLQNDQEVGFYPSADLFFSLQVKKFRAFVRWFNITELLLPDQLYYQTAFYPYPPGSNLRIGIDWRFTE